MIDKNTQRQILVQVVPGLSRALDERVAQRMPGGSAQDRLDMKRSIVCHVMAALLLEATKEEIANFGDLVGALINIARGKKGKASAVPPTVKEDLG